jgi:hypothetical protein
LDNLPLYLRMIMFVVVLALAAAAFYFLEM